jgi:hypothetical protein
VFHSVIKAVFKVFFILKYIKKIFFYILKIIFKINTSKQFKTYKNKINFNKKKFKSFWERDLHRVPKRFLRLLVIVWRWDMIIF